jgi:hypothetical protein
MNNMKEQFEVITGQENIDLLNDLRIKALIKFYKAFNHQDIEAMNQVWYNSGNSIMNNPVGGMVKGYENIMEVYHRIFYGTVRVYVEFTRFEIFGDDQMFVAIGTENGHYVYKGREYKLNIRTSRIYMKGHGIWWQVHHHGSIDNPVLLWQYQQAIRNGNKSNVNPI